VLAKDKLLAIDKLYAYETLSVGEGCFNRIGQTRGHVWPYDQTIHDNVDAVVQISLKVRKGIKQSDIAVDADAQKSLAFDLLEFLAVLAFAMAHNRRQNEQTPALWQAQHLIHDLLHGLGAHRLATASAMRHAQARKEQTQIVVDFGDSTHGRARVATDRFLLDGDRWRQAFDGINIWLFKLFEKLASIGREGFNIPTLAFSINGIERE